MRFVPNEKRIEMANRAVAVPEPVRGVLQKWTNYIHGWQKRYFILDSGTLAYYKSEKDTSFGCRGAVAIAKAIIHVSNNC